MSSHTSHRLLMSCSALPLAATLAIGPVWSQSTGGSPLPTSQQGQEGPFQIRFFADTLVLEPVLNVALKDKVRGVVFGEELVFETFNNYAAFIKSAEVRVFAAGQSPDSEPLAKLVPDANGLAKWRAPQDGIESLYFVYRVVGVDGKFDETAPQELTLVRKRLPHDLDFGEKPEERVVARVDQTARRTIELTGLMARVTGRADVRSDRVVVNGQTIDIDRDGKFVARQIVPRVGGKLDVVVSRNGQEIKRASQSFSQAGDDWFIVGQGDLVVGRSSASGPARAVSGERFAQGDYNLGRAAFYAKGVTENDVRITASVDTGETSLRDMFSNLDRKDPRQLLRRLNSENFYPTYGDDSTLVEDAPTQGRFYFRAAKGASQAVIGNFTTDIGGSELVQLDRGLFGALVDIGSQGITSFGERTARVTAFASDSGTIPGREEFRGTGGSLYFLKRQDISIGSERVRIEIRDRETGIILETRALYAQQDYDFDPFQGRITLLEPLSSTASTGGVVREGSSTGNVPVLVVRYEYTPPVGSLTASTLGARGSMWWAERLRFGVTGQRDDGDNVEQTVFGVDALYRVAAGTYARAEIAQSKGQGFDQSNSIDGGLSFVDITNPGSNARAQSWRSELALNFAEMTNRSGDLGSASAFYERADKGFAVAGRLSLSDMDRWGVALNMPLSTTTKLVAKFDELTSQEAGFNRTGLLDLSNRFSIAQGALTTKLGLRYEDRTPGLLYNSVQDGQRTDAAFELGFAPNGRNWEVLSFVQGTLNRDATRQRNNRAGIGAKFEVTQRLSFEGELSGGDGGQGADVKLNHRRSNGSEAYVGYSLFTDRTDTGVDPQNIFTRANRGTLTVGGRQRFSDALSFNAENRVGIGGTAPSLSRAFGLRFEPTEKLSLSGSVETGKIDDATSGLFRRTAASLAIGYSAEDIRLGSAIEFRHEDGVGRDQNVWLFRNNLTYAVNPDWRFVGQVNIARADNTNLSIAAAEFTEAMAGFAYRPVDNERFNALFRLNYFEDLGPVGQVTGAGQVQSPKQKSTILSIDGNYDLNEHWTLGAKYGYREGRVSLSRESDQYVSADAHLGVIRVTYDVVKDWEVLAEARGLWVSEAKDQRLGALGAVYRHLGNNVKIGIGYSWSEFSDDLTDQSYTSKGPFLNLVGKF